MEVLNAFCGDDYHFLVRVDGVASLATQNLDRDFVLDSAQTKASFCAFNRKTEAWDVIALQQGRPVFLRKFQRDLRPNVAFGTGCGVFPWITFPRKTDEPDFTDSMERAERSSAAKVRRDVQQRQREIIEEQRRQITALEREVEALREK